jgi:anti-anti-sigma factor
MSIELPKLSGGVISAEASSEGGVVHVRFSGTADLEAKDDLQGFVNKLHREAERISATKVIVDFRELEFMNSSCFKIFVAWLAQVRDLDPSKQYRIHLLSNPSLLWQRRSLAALSCFAVDLVAIET